MPQLSIKSTITDESFITNEAITAIAVPLLQKQGLTGMWFIELSFVDNEEICRLNQQAQGKNEPTDVLSFPVHFATNEADPHAILPETAQQILGSIVIATDVAAAQAVTRNHSTEAEIKHLVEHGIHHLLGEDHDDQGMWLPRATHDDFHRRNNVIQL